MRKNPLWKSKTENKSKSKWPVHRYTLKCKYAQATSYNAKKYFSFFTHNYLLWTSTIVGNNSCYLLQQSLYNWPVLLEGLALALAAVDPMDLQVWEGEERLFITDLCCLKAWLLPWLQRTRWTFRSERERNGFPHSSQYSQSDLSSVWCTRLPIFIIETVLPIRIPPGSELITPFWKELLPGGRKLVQKA